MLPTFPLGYVWRLMLFATQYHELQVYRPDIIIPFGILSMLIQAALLSWLFSAIGHRLGTAWPRQGLLFGLATGAFAWSLSAVAVSAKHVMASVPLYLALETGFTTIQYLVVGQLIAFVYRHRP